MQHLGKIMSSVEVRRGGGVRRTIKVNEWCKRQVIFLSLFFSLSFQSFLSTTSPFPSFSHFLRLLFPPFSFTFSTFSFFYFPLDCILVPLGAALVPLDALFSSLSCTLFLPLYFFLRFSTYIFFLFSTFFF